MPSCSQVNEKVHVTAQLFFYWWTWKQHVKALDPKHRPKFFCIYFWKAGLLANKKNFSPLTPKRKRKKKLYTFQSTHGSMWHTCPYNHISASRQKEVIMPRLKVFYNGLTAKHQNETNFMFVSFWCLPSVYEKSEGIKLAAASALISILPDWNTEIQQKIMTKH